MNAVHIIACIALTMLVSGAPRSAHAATDSHVAKLIEQSGIALHIAALPAMRVVHAKGGVAYSGLDGNGEMWNEMGRRRDALRFSTAPLGGGIGWDGHADWSLDQTGLVVDDTSVLGLSSSINQAYFENYDLWTPGFGGAIVAWAGRKIEDGTAYDILHVTPPNSRIPIDIYFNAAHLPAKMVQIAAASTTTITLKDFKAVGALMIAAKTSIASNTGDDIAFIATSFEVNPPDGVASLRAPRSSPHDFSIADGATRTSVQIDTSENHAYLSVMLDGKGPFRFALDTGGANVLDSAVAEKLGLSRSGATQVNGFGSQSATSSYAKIRTLQIGSAQVDNQIFALLPISKGLGKAHGVSIEGFIGYEVLSRFVTTLDYASKKVIFQMPGSAASLSGATAIPIAMFGTQPQFACALDGVAATCTLDTGARNAISFYAPFAATHPTILPRTFTASGVDGYGIGGPNVGRLGRVQSLSFGGLTLHNLIGDYAKKTGGGLAMPFLGANIGGDVWKRFAMTLDYRKLTVTLKPNSTLRLPDSWDRSGLYLLDEGAITIIDVRPGTPAARTTLAKGDAIVSVNGAKGLSLRQVRDLFTSKSGSVERLVVKRRDGTQRSVALTLADYV